MVHHHSFANIHGTMHIYNVAILSSLSILIPAFTGMIRIKSIPAAYYSFLAVLWLGMANEILNLVFVQNVKNNMFSSNMYVLLECLLLIWQFYKWHTISRVKTGWLIAGSILLWITDNLWLHSIQEYNAVFRVIYAFTLMLLCTQQIAKSIVAEKNKLSANSVFLICITFLLFFGIKMYIESFNIIQLAVSTEFYRNLWMIMLIVNLLANILYTIAIVCIRSKQAFTYPHWYQ